MNRVPASGVCLLLALCLAACGKVGPPLPPVVAIPEPVDDLRVTQAGYDLRFEWTNPRLHVDQTPAETLTRLVIRAGDSVVSELAPGEPGEAQSALLRDVRDRVGETLDFTIEVAGSGGRFSSPSPVVALTIVDVPGEMSPIEATVDEGVIALSWGPPAENDGLAEGVRIYRSGDVLADLPADSRSFEDASWVAGQTYSYSVVGVRSGPDGVIEGIPSAPLGVVAADVTPPASPSGLTLRVVADGALVRWEPSPERDLGGYRVYRQTDGAGDFLVLNSQLELGTGFTDTEYSPGMAYRVTAVDRTGNESDPSGSVF